MEPQVTKPPYVSVSSSVKWRLMVVPISWVVVRIREINPCEMLSTVPETQISLNECQSCYYPSNKAPIPPPTFHPLHHCCNPSHFHLLPKFILSSIISIILKHKSYQGVLLFKNSPLLRIKPKLLSLVYRVLGDLIHPPPQISHSTTLPFLTEPQLCLPACCY